jgi:hypothetical protein
MYVLSFYIYYCICIEYLFSWRISQLGTLKAKISKLKSELINGPGGKSAGSKDAGRGFDGTCVCGALLPVCFVSLNPPSHISHGTSHQIRRHTHWPRRLSFRRQVHFIDFPHRHQKRSRRLRIHHPHVHSRDHEVPRRAHSSPRFARDH